MVKIVSYKEMLRSGQPYAFFCRAKPQNANALDIFKKAGRVFIGYPLLRERGNYNPEALQSCLVDPNKASDKEWENALEANELKGRQRSQFTRNRNFVRKVTPDSIVVIPRPSEGCAHVARIVGKFHIVDSPEWAGDYEQLRREQNLDNHDEDLHIADVAQGWKVDKYRQVALPRLPGWLRHSMLGRSTYGWLYGHPLDKDTTAYGVLDRILSGSANPISGWTLDTEQIGQRLIDALNPSSFEHLIVSLLQLEHPDEIWSYTGGPGDGGIDGLGSSVKGEVVGLMQAKLWADQAPDLGNLCRDKEVRRYAAVLIPKEPAPPSDDTCLLKLEWITDAVRRHWRSLPQAHAIRAGEPEEGLGV